MINWRASSAPVRLPTREPFGSCGAGFFLPLVVCPRVYFWVDLPRRISLHTHTHTHGSGLKVDPVQRVVRKPGPVSHTQTNICADCISIRSGEPVVGIRRRVPAPSAAPPTLRRVMMIDHHQRSSWPLMLAAPATLLLHCQRFSAGMTLREQHNVARLAQLTGPALFPAIGRNEEVQWEYVRRTHFSSNAAGIAIIKHSTSFVVERVPGAPPGHQFQMKWRRKSMLGDFMLGTSDEETG